MDCLVCGGHAVITPPLFDGHNARWDCVRCPTWGTISVATGAKDEDETEATP